MEQSLLALLIGFILDLILGDPHEVWHPVQGIGWLITKTERIVRRIFPHSKTGERIAGAALAVIVVGCSAAVPWILLRAAGMIHPAARIVLESVFCYQMLATKSLKDESMKVYNALKTSGTAAGRQAVSMIVGRDTACLDEEGVVKAAVETIAENTSDGIIAPMFYMVLGGGVLGYAYKAVNTMDSMIGYKNEMYQYFGTCAARLDDIVNFIPARLSALFMILGTFPAGGSVKNAVRIFFRDRKNHKSPNSAQTEAVMAGALEIRLAGDAYYFGKLHKKPTIGDSIRAVETEDIVRANRLLYVTAVIGLILMTGLKLLWMK